MRCRHCKKTISTRWRIQNSEVSTVQSWLRQHAGSGFSLKQLWMLYNGTTNTCAAQALHTMMIQIWCHHCSNPRLLHMNYLWSKRKNNGHRKNPELQYSHCMKSRSTGWRIHNSEASTIAHWMRQSADFANSPECLWMLHGGIHSEEDMNNKKGAGKVHVMHKATEVATKEPLQTRRKRWKVLTRTKECQI